MEDTSPEDHGWMINDGKLDIQWMTCSPAPEEVFMYFSLLNCLFASATQFRYSNL